MPAVTVRRFELPALFAVLVCVSVLHAACGSSEPTSAAAPPPPSELHAFTGTHTRIVWVQHDGTDSETMGDQLIVMGLDSDDGKGERVIVGDRGSYLKPRLTSDGQRIIVSSRVMPGPPEIFIVNWDGSGFRKLADGFAMTVWRNPADGRDWVYAGSDNENYDFATVTRFPVDAPSEREVVWNTSLVSMEGFNVSPDGRLAGGMYPWPDAGVAVLPNGEVTRFGEGCWTGFSFARGPMFWYFDGAHRNVTMVDVDSSTRWMVNLNDVEGFAGAEVSHPRWANHPRFLAITGPYNQGGANQVRSGGPQVEIYVGRFTEDFSDVEEWLRVTNNAGGDAHPDVWMDLDASPYPVRASGRVGPPNAVSARERGGGPTGANADRVVLNVRLERSGPIPDPKAILPYRNALVVSEYEVADVLDGEYAAKWIQIAQWAIRDGKVLPGAEKTAGAGFTLTVERYDAHPELEGERLISAAEETDLPLYYEPTAP